jgi:hypothetical protein
MMQQAAQDRLPLLPEWAFVVQFNTGTEMPQEQCAGRVEHVVSGQATHFDSVEGLLTFIGQVLTGVRAQMPGEP